MFTGIITDIGTVDRAEPQGDLRIVVRTGYDMARVDLGASIACSGVCLTVVDKGTPGADGAPGWFAADVSHETISRSAVGQWQVGRRLNLERAMKLGDELGGHIVTGHVDGVGTVIAAEPDGESRRIMIRIGDALSPYLATKGSVTVDGVSLTVNSVSDHAGGADFAVNIIPHTQAVTTLGTLAVGQAVNIEIDVLARYLARIDQQRRWASDHALTGTPM